MPKPNQRRFHLTLDPPVPINLGEHLLIFIGLTMLNRAVMVEYLAAPPLPPFYPFSPAFDLQVTDDADPTLYPTFYENKARPEFGEGRTSTTLSRRPPPEATTMQFVIRDSPDADPRGAFEVSLPPEHGVPWRPGFPSEIRVQTTECRGRTAQSWVRAWVRSR
jgi:hypothetical protein